MVSVVMPVFNGAPHVAEAVASVLGQTLEPEGDRLELLAIDDGSTDGSGTILDDLARHDQRLRVVHQANAGAVAALNRGLDEALRGPAQFVAIMHADDICLPERLRRQVDYLTAHSQVAGCGTWIKTFGGPEAREWRYPEEPRFTKAFLLFWCCFAHPTMMFRRQVLDPGAGGEAEAGGGYAGGTRGEKGARYDPHMPMPCEDYAFWAELSRTHLLANVPEVLLLYRQHAGQGGAVHRAKNAALTEAIRRRQIEQLAVAPTAEEMVVHQQLAESDLVGTREFVVRARKWLERLWVANEAAGIYECEALGKVLGGRWAAVCVDAASHGVDGIWREFWDCALAEFVDRTGEKNRVIPPCPPPAPPR